MIDTLILNLHKSIVIKEIIEKAETNSLSCIPKKFDEGWNIRIGSGIWIRFRGQLHSPHGEVYRIRINPTKFPSFVCMMKEVEAIFPEVDRHIITRMDLAADIQLHFIDCLRGFDALLKRKGYGYIDFSQGKVTQITLGKRPHEVTMYDKSAQIKDFLKPLTRVETRFYQKRVPETCLSQLPTLAKKILNGECDPFSNVTLYNISVLEKVALLSRTQQLRCVKMCSILDIVGYGLTRRHLDRHGNFSRDERKFFSKHPIYPSPIQILKKNVANYFNLSEEL